MSNELEQAFGSESERATQKLLDLQRRCVRCDKAYRERRNIGSWSCRAYHPGVHYLTTHQTKFACCGGALDSIGCVPADHTDYYEFQEWENVSEPVADAVRKAHAAALRPPLPERRGATSWQFDPTERQWTVRRYDAEAYADALARTKAKPRYDLRHNEGFSAEQLYS